MKQNPDGTPDLSSLDPAVAAVLRQDTARQAKARMPKDQRKKRERERRKLAARNRVTYDLPQELDQAIKQLANEEHTSASQIAKFALQLLLREIASEHINLRDYRIPISNPNYECAIRDIFPLGVTP